MGWADNTGFAHVNPRAPRAFGVCDYGGEWRQLHELKKQMEWQGTKLVWTGLLVCSHHMDKPQQQLRAIRLPADPVPKINPRPETGFLPSVQTQGFQIYSLWDGGFPLDYAALLTDGNGNEILDNYGNPIQLEIGHDGVALLAQLSKITGIAIPGNIQSYGGTLAKPLVAQALVPASAARSYIAIFNPCTAPLWVSTGTAVPGIQPSVILGPGDCAFWATAQNYGQPYTGAMTVVGNLGGLPYYVYSN
jgi:hypothetical protein